MLNRNEYAVGTFSNRTSAEYALKVLTTSGVQTAQIFVFVIDAENDEQFGEVGIGARSCYKAGDETATCATIIGSMIGAIVGCLIGLGILVVPGVGAIFLIGSSGTTLTAALAGTGVGIASGSLISALARRNTPEREADSESVFQNNYLIVVKGTKEEVRHAEAMLRK